MTDWSTQLVKLNGRTYIEVKVRGHYVLVSPQDGSNVAAAIQREVTKYVEAECAKK